MSATLCCGVLLLCGEPVELYFDVDTEVLNLLRLCLDDFDYSRACSAFWKVLQGGGMILEKMLG